jgi:hypothetical protein
MKHYIGQDKQPPGASVVYWVRRPEYTDIFTQGYVGISSQPVKDRWADHSRDSNRHNGILRTATKGHKDTIYEVVVVAQDRGYCERIERLLRPKERIGWNLAPGGGNPDNKAGGATNRLRHIKIKLANTDKACHLWWESERKMLKRQAIQIRLKARESFVPYTGSRKLDARNQCGYTGVSWYKPYGKWRAQIKMDDGPKFLGYFDDPSEAHKVYLEHKAQRVADLRARANLKVKN